VSRRRHVVVKTSSHNRIFFLDAFSSATHFIERLCALAESSCVPLVCRSGLAENASAANTPVFLVWRSSRTRAIAGLTLGLLMQEQTAAQQRPTRET
jgi:hypothetical protein